MQTPVKIFVVYAHEDKSVRDKLLRQLRPLADSGELALWSDHEIKPGEVWEDEIRLRLTQSEIILLIVSDDFFASDYIRQVELHTALDLHDRGATQLLPVIARHCGWADLPTLSRLQVLPPEGRPVLSKEWDSPDEPYLKIYEGVKATVRDVQRRKQMAALALDTPPIAQPIYSSKRTNRKWWLMALALLLVFTIWMVKYLASEHKSPENAIMDHLPKDSSEVHQKQVETKDPASSVSLLKDNESSKTPVGQVKELPEGQNKTPERSSKPILPRIDSPKNNSVTIPLSPLYDQKLETVEGMTRIIKGRQQSFLNLNGQWIGKWFDDAENFHDGVAFVKLKGRHYWIDKTGNCVKGCN
ncbi:MAG: toll/interleukin-1 receptor domain-containing protein [Saprospiraceae bacterium]